jgi:hypothetical protein
LSFRHGEAHAHVHASVKIMKSTFISKLDHDDLPYGKPSRELGRQPWICCAR